MSLINATNFFRLAHCLYKAIGIILNLIFCFVTVGWFTSVYAQKELPDELPLLETIRFELLSTDNGMAKYTIKAHEMRQYKSGNVELQGDIEIVLLENKGDKEPGEVSMHIQANKLSYNKKQKLCVIEGNVLIRKPNDQFIMMTEQLSYDTDKEIFFTEVPIEIEHKKNVLRGHGLHATKDFKQYTINGPQGTIDMEQV